MPRPANNIGNLPNNGWVLETCNTVNDKITGKKWKTNQHMGFANANVLPMEMFGRKGRDSHATPLLADAVEGCAKQVYLMIPLPISFYKMGDCGPYKPNTLLILGV